MSRRGVSRIEHIRQSCPVWNRHQRVSGCAGLLVFALMALSLGGCSWSWQLGSLLPDDGDITGSIKPREVSPLSPDLTGEDWRRAKAAMAVALDIQGDGKTVNWDNPDSGAKGSFTPVGTPFVVKTDICRAFLADLRGKLPATTLQGSACRNGPDDWLIKDVKPFAKAAEGKPAAQGPAAVAQALPPMPAGAQARPAPVQPATSPAKGKDLARAD